MGLSGWLLIFGWDIMAATRFPKFTYRWAHSSVLMNTVAADLGFSLPTLKPTRRSQHKGVSLLQACSVVFLWSRGTEGHMNSQQVL